MNTRMITRIVQASDPVTLLGGGDLHPQDLNLALARAPVLVAADGGADAALAAGHVPQAVIGDFDSLSAQARQRIPKDRLFHVPEQDSTDFDKALRHVSAPLVLGIGFLGGRLDHQLAVLNTLVRRGHRCLLIGAHEVVVHLPAQLHLDLQPGDTVSLFPMCAVSGRSHGLQWPIDGLAFAPDGQVGTSNRAEGAVTLWTDGPGLLAMVPRARLDQVIRAVLSADA